MPSHVMLDRNAGRTVHAASLPSRDEQSTRLRLPQEIPHAFADPHIGGLAASEDVFGTGV